MMSVDNVSSAANGKPAIPDVSAVICTYNRAALLRGAIESLVTQSLDPQRYEVIVVDNNCTDETSQVVEEAIRKWPDRTIRRIEEPRPGLGHARNAGLEHSKGAYVAYLDDDAVADARWLEEAVKLFATVAPRPLCVGGVIEPYYLDTKPAWFKDEYEIRSSGNEPRWLARGESFSGSNMIWDRTTLGGLDAFPSELGMRGSQIGAGEESAAFCRLWEAEEAPPLWYSPTLRVKHLAGPKQMTVRYRLKRAWAQGSTLDRRGDLADRPRQIAERLLRAFWAVRHPVFGLIRFRERAWQQWMVEEFTPLMFALGSLAAAAGLSIEVRQR